jgi:hypothetical protein
MPLPLTDTVSVCTGVPTQVAALGAYRSNSMLPVGLLPSLSVAESLSAVPTGPLLGSGVVTIAGLAIPTITGSSWHSLLTLALFESPL